MRMASWLRFQLAGVILIGLLPIAALISFLGYQDRRSAIEHATEFIIRASESAVGAQSRIIDSSRTLLGVLARLPLALHPESPECGALLSAIKTDQPRYANLGIADPDGNILCSALPMAHPFSAADRSWFQRAVQSADFAVGDYQVGRITGKASLNVALPAKDADGRIASVAFAALDLDWLAGIVAGAELPPGGSFTLFDSEGTVLARYPEPERWTGRSVAETPLFEAIRRRDPGSSFEAVGLDGRIHLYNVVRLGDADAGSGVYASIGVPTEEIVAEANRDLARGLGGVGAVGLLLFLGAYVAGDRLITKPMRKLVDLSRRIAGGDFTARSELDHGGGEIGQLAQSLDSMVAALEKREKDLRESESRLRAFMDNAPVLMIVKDLEGRVVLANKGVLAAFGAPPESVLGRRSADFLRPDHAALIAEHERLVLETGEAVAREIHIEDRPGMEWSYEVKFPLRDTDGRINAIAGVIVDITDRKRAEAERERQMQRAAAGDRRCREIFNATQDGIVTIDRGGTILSFNPAAERLFGYRAEEAVGQNVSMLMPSPYREEHDRYLSRYLETGQARVIGSVRELEGRRKDGTTFPITLKVSELRQAGEAAFVGIVQDITDRKAAEEALRQSERRFRHLVESANVIPSVYDVATQRVTYIGPQGADMLGYSAADWSNEGFWLGHVHPDDREALASLMSTHTEPGNRYDIEYRMVAADGGTVWMRDVVNIEAGEDGRAVGYGLTFDITETKSREQQLAQAQKMETVGQLTGGVAHDFNNLLTIVLGNLELLEPSVGGDASALRRIRVASEAAMRGAELTRQLLAFARRQVLTPKVVEMNKSVSGIAELLRRSVGEAIEIKMLLSPDLWPTRIDPTQLEATVLNMAINARDAMSGGGVLTIETSNQYLSEEYTAHHADVSAGEYAMLAVSDTGTGMSAEVLRRAFEPFFTTKEVGKGTGLGLSMAYGFVKQSGGHVAIYSKEGHGTTVKLYFPRAEVLVEDSADRTESVAPRQEHPTGTETILVVEDDASVRETAIALLEKLGYRVLHAADGPSALAMIEQRPTVELLFTDVGMPGGMNGVTLARKVAERWPHIRVLYTSGYTDTAIARGGKLDIKVEWVGKPYFKADLARKVRQVLDAPAAKPPSEKSP